MRTQHPGGGHYLSRTTRLGANFHPYENIYAALLSPPYNHSFNRDPGPDGYCPDNAPANSDPGLAAAETAWLGAHGKPEGFPGSENGFPHR